jgi:nucleoside-diphosphate-sugar epimerase
MNGNQGAVALTGATGFIGSAIQNVSSIPVVAVGRSLVLPPQPTALLHAAWYANPIDYLHSSANIEAADHAIAAARAASLLGIPFVGLGSCAEYAATASDLSESSETASTSRYAAEKLRAMRETRAICEQAGTRWVWARVFHPFGPGEKKERLVPSVVNALQQNMHIDLGPCDQVRDQIDVRDVASALLTLCSSDIQGVVNVASGTGMVLRDWLTLMAGEQSALLRFAASISQASDLLRVVGSSNRLRSVGWLPIYPSPPHWEQLL